MFGGISHEAIFTEVRRPADRTFGCIFNNRGGVVLFSSDIIRWLPEFLETAVFHRTFDHEAYFESLVSLISYPVFFVIVIDALIFLKFSNGQKNALLLIFIFFAFFITAFVTYRFCSNYKDPDAVSEYLLARECWLTKCPIPPTWCYSTEIRVLNTQLIAAPLFLFTKNLVLIRTITVTASLAIVFFSTLFLLSVLNVKILWVKLLCGLLIICPASWTAWQYFHSGSYYTPHVAISFIYTGIFILLAFRELPKSRKRILAAVYLFLAFCGGLGSIRYLLNFILPLAAVTVGGKIIACCKRENRLAWKSVISAERDTFWAFLGFAACAAGYLVNTAVLSNLYAVKNYNKVQFLPFGEATVSGAIDMIMQVIGWNENASVFTPAGFATMLIAAAAAALAVLLLKRRKLPAAAEEAAFFRFVLSVAVFSLYINICTEMVPRFLITTAVFFIPVLALLMTDGRLLGLYRWMLAASSAVLILTNAFGIWTKFQVRENSSGLKKACAFLTESGYAFGYSFFADANPAWFLSGGKLEVAELTADEAADGTKILPERFIPSRWLTVKRYFRPGYAAGARAFLLMEEEDFKNAPEHRALRNGRIVYRADGFVIFDYESPDAFKASFD